MPIFETPDYLKGMFCNETLFEAIDSREGWRFTGIVVLYPLGIDCKSLNLELHHSKLLVFNMNNKFFSILIVVFFIWRAGNAQESAGKMQEPYRPQVHFSPAAHWINDPNGMLYYAGVYHLFYQHHPYSAVWGPMHWGHATSKDLIHWKQQPIALYPDSLGYIFSGSAVADVNNTSGFAKKGKAPLVAIFTSNDPK